MGLNEPAFSRNGTTTESVKCTSRIDVPVSEGLEEKLIALAVMAGKPKAEFARMLLPKAIEGELAYMRSVGAIPQRSNGINEG